MTFAQTGFVTVKYGENEECILNNWVPSHLLLKFCLLKCMGKEQLKDSQNLRFDLMDTNGKLRELQDNPNMYANQLIAPRQTYILVKIERRDEEEAERYTSLLHDIGRLYPKVKAKLDELSNYKVSGKVGARWAKIKTVSKFAGMGTGGGKISARSTSEEKTLDRRMSMNSLASSDSEHGAKTGRKSSAKGTARKKKEK